MIGRIAAVAYVGTVAGLTAYAFRSPDAGFGRAEAAAAVLALPALVPALPVIYLLGALAWNLHDAGAPMALVTATFTVLMTATAVADVLLWRWVRRVAGGS